MQRFTPEIYAADQNKLHQDYFVGREIFAEVMCQHFSGQLVTQIFVFFRTPHIPLVINNH